MSCWLNEGLADYHEVGGRVDGSFRGGQRHEEHIRLLPQRHDVVPLARLLFMERAEFHRDAPLHYAQSWAFVHFLRQGPLRAALREVDLEALQRAIAAYLEGF